MKKFLALIAVLMLTVGLVACGDDKEEETPDVDKDASEETGSEDEGNTDEGEESEDTKDGASDGEISNEKFNEVLALLSDNGFEVSGVIEGNTDVVGSTDAVMAVINGEDALTFEAFEMEEGHDNLKQVEENGEATMDFDGMEGEVPAWSKGNFVFMLPDGHPNYDEVVELVNNEFDAE